MGGILLRLLHKDLGVLLEGSYSRKHYEGVDSETEKEEKQTKEVFMIELL